MSKPILTFALSDDENSVFVYTGVLQTNSDGVITYGELEAVLGVQHDDFDRMVSDYAVHGVREALLSKQPH